MPASYVLLEGVHMWTYYVSMLGTGKEGGEERHGRPYWVSEHYVGIKHIQWVPL